jgi:hypothetical protein
MKQFFLLAGIFTFNESYAATGSASDGELAVFSVILILMLPVVLVYFIGYIKSRFKDYKEKKLYYKNMLEHNGETGI